MPKPRRSENIIAAKFLLFSDDSAIWLMHRSAFYSGLGRRIPDIIKILRFEQPSLLMKMAKEVVYICDEY